MYVGQDRYQQDQSLTDDRFCKNAPRRSRLVLGNKTRKQADGWCCDEITSPSVEPFECYRLVGTFRQSTDRFCLVSARNFSITS
jgi:hypothetical protein